MPWITHLSPDSFEPVVKEEKSFKIFLFLALVVILFRRTEQFVQFFQRALSGTFMQI